MDQGQWVGVSGKDEERVEIVPKLDRLLDSVILIDHFNGIPQATEYLRKLMPEQTAISVITWAEILVGFEGQSAEKVIQFLMSSLFSPSIDLPPIKPLKCAGSMAGSYLTPFRRH